ncbi:MAG TPA: pyridoxal phosphate-dependent aminotransferase [Spirochaetia bacterium]|nr:pyridoxal phosphate-dependent aminotransferase [Spirochaetia bacterium]
MEKNLLQQELERIRRHHEVADLIDTNFHRNGYRFPAEPIGEAMTRYLLSRSYDPDPRGAAEARRSICGYYARAGVAVSPERILLTASSSESYSLLFNNLAAPGDNILLPRPTYPLFEYLAGFSHVEVRYYDLDPSKDFKIDANSMLREIDSRTRFIVLISPNNPTGRIAGPKEIETVIEIAASRGIAVICDEVFSEFLYDGASLTRPMKISSDRKSDLLLFTLNGISKMFASPDLKLSWIVVGGPEREASAAVETLEVANDMFLNCNSFSQFLLPVLFDSGDEFRNHMVTGIDRGRRALLERLTPPQFRLSTPNGGIHATVELCGLPAGYDDERFAVELLRNRHVYVHPGYLYGIEKGTFIVVSFLREYRSLVPGLDGVASFMQELSRSASPSRSGGAQ